MRLSGTKATAIHQYRGLGNQLWDLAGNRPSLDLRFADNKSLVDATTGSNLVNFTRPSSGTYVDSEGVIRTATTNEARFDHDPTTGESLGLLVEEQRTNLLLNSGTLSTQSVTVTAVAHTLSFTGTGTITLTGTSTAGPLVGTGIGESNRVILTFTPTAGSLTLTVSGTVTNAQLEAGSFRTSYIPTTDAAATRSEDVASISGSNFSSWYRQDEGTVLIDTQRTKINGFPRRFRFTDGTSANSISSFWDAPNNSSTFNMTTSSVFQFAIFGGGGALETFVKAGFGLKNNDTAVFYGGNQTGGTQTSVSLPVVSEVEIASNAFNGWVKRLTYWPVRLSNSTLQTITQ